MYTVQYTPEPEPEPEILDSLASLHAYAGVSVCIQCRQVMQDVSLGINMQVVEVGMHM